MTQRTLWVDVTRTMCWHGNPVGIMRVEFELARYYLTLSLDKHIKFLAYCFITHHFYEISREALTNKLKLIEKPLVKTPYIFKIRLPVRLNKLINKKISIFTQVLENGYLISKKRANFIKGDILFISGPSWTYPGITDCLTLLKYKVKINIALVVYDLIPVLYEHLSSKGAKAQHTHFHQQLFNIVDTYFCISKQTEVDLLSFAGQHNQTIHTQLIQLGTDFYSDTIKTSNHAKSLNALGIQEPFILFVSTIEARKNHILLYKAYQLLLEEGHKDIPLMVWVGRPGWGTQDLLHELSNNIAMKNKILILHEVNDATLNELYRDCLYTLYPSLYEGWGLPVAESLGRGKFCLSSSAASLPEVGQGLTLLLNPYDTRVWANAILQLQTTADLATYVQQIADNYHPITWQQAGERLTKQLQAFDDI